MFKDDWKTTNYFKNLGSVFKCPECGSLARKVQSEVPYFICSRAGSKCWKGTDTPDYFLSKNFKGTHIYAVNGEHLEYMRQIISSDLRQSDHAACQGCPACNPSVMTSLPKVMLAGSNRQPLLKLFAQWEKQLAELDAK